MTPTRNQLAADFADAERIWLAMSPANLQWLARFDERQVDEARVARAATTFYAGLQRQWGSARDLGVMSEEVLTARRRVSKLRRRTVDEQALLASVNAELAARLDPALGTELVRSMEKMILEVSQRAERSILAVMFGTALGKQAGADSVPGVRWTPQSLAHTGMREKLVLDVEASIEGTGAAYTGDVANTIVTAADPAAPKTIGELTRAITGDVTRLSRRKARVIARTETARVYGQTAHESMVVNQIKKRRWLTAANSPIATSKPPDDKCLNNATAGWVAMFQPFPSGDMHAPAHPNCRCDVAPNTDDWLPPSSPISLDGFVF